METVLLKNGSSEMKPVVVMTFMNLKKMLEDLNGITAFYELVEICKDSSHKIFSEAQKEYLVSRALMQSDGRVHQSIKNVVLSSIDGEGRNISLISPYAQ